MWKLFILGVMLVVGFVVFQLRRNTYYKGPVSDHFDGTRFLGAPRTTGFKDFLKWRLQADASIWPQYGPNEFEDTPPARVEGDELRVSWVGHATFLIQTQGLNILMDPVWSEHMSPVSWAGPKRVHPPGIAFENLPPIDVVLVTHNHYDHLDLDTLERLWKRDSPRIITPLGNDAIIKKADPTIRSWAYDWGQGTRLKEGVDVFIEPAQHWSSRWGLDNNHALWASFVIRTPGGNLYLVGDTGYGNGDLFVQARKKYTSFRFAILPIGAFQPRWFMAYSHMDPEEALKAYKDLGQPYFAPSHFGTVKLAYDGYDEAPKLLKEQAIEQNIPPEHLRILRIGQHWNVPSR